MDALIFLAHGSRRQKSNDEVIDLADKVRTLTSVKYDRVEAAFLEITAPSLSEMITHLLEQSAKTITIYPYFLNSGTHVEQDIPAIIENFRDTNPDCRFTVMRHFGQTKEIVDMIADQILQV